MSVTIPTSPDELEDLLKDDKRVKEVYDNGGLAELVTNYTKAFNKKNPDVERTIAEEVQHYLTNYLKQHKEEGFGPSVNLNNKSVPALGRKKGEVYNAAAPGAALDRTYEGTAEFFQAIWHQRDSLNNSVELGKKANEWRKLQNSFGSVVPADGGFLIPEQLRSEILSLSLENSVVRPRARVIPMSSLTLPIPAIDETSRASSVFGGIVAYWTEEGAAATESQAKFGRVKLEAKKLTIYCEAPNELVADAPGFGALLNDLLPEAVTFYEDDAFINGSGVGEPLGVLNGDGVISPTRVTSNEVDFTDIVNMYTRMLPSSLGRAVWICSPAVIAQLLQLAMTRGTDGIASPPLWLTGGQLFGGPTMSLLGRPLIVSEKVPDLGTTGDISFIDFGHYLVGDRQAMQATSSPHFKFSSDVTAYKIVERVDGRPWLQTALTPKNSGSTLSPYVTLNATQT